MHVANIILGHPKGSKIEGDLLYCIKCDQIFSFLVVELDCPWDAAQCEEYGPLFTPWSESMIKGVIKLLCKTLVSRPWTFVVFKYRGFSQCVRYITTTFKPYIGVNG